MASSGTSLDTGNLSADQRGTILEVLRTVRRPAPKLLLVPLKRFSMLGVRVGADGLAQVRREPARHRSDSPPFSSRKSDSDGDVAYHLSTLFGGVDRRRVVAGEEARLELSNPVVAFQEGVGGLTCHALLEGALRESTIVERAELRGLSA